MVLGSNKWATDKDDKSKSSTALDDTGSSELEANAQLLHTTANNQNSNKPIAALEGLGAVEIEAGTVELPSPIKNSKRQRTKAKKLKMDTKKSDDDNMVDTTAPEKHENETREQNEAIDVEMNATTPSNTGSLSNSEVENNNIEEYTEHTSNLSDTNGLHSVCDSNTNTLQSLERQLTYTGIASPPLNNLLNISAPLNVTANKLYNSLNMSSLNNGALQQQQQQLQPPVSQETISAGNASTVIVPKQPPAEMLNISSIDTNGEAKIVLHCEPKSHKFDTRTIYLMPNQDCKVGRLIAKSKASEGNAIFDCKVLSRNHAVLWYTPDGQFWVKDTRSSNGTFINDNKLGLEPAQLRFGDTVKFGVEVIENSRQEVHGCIIARVNLFLPDGREAISIDPDQVQLAGPNRISFDEIQRLNGFMHETAQREKLLKAKLNNVQNVLDTTRKNSAMCWQSMITEDQLLHKINLLEKKLQVVEKNVPENALRNEIVKMLEEKTSYQLTAKEALRKVYQERCDALQLLSKMEMAYATSESEVTILRTQIQVAKQNLHDFNVRMDQLQTEYMEYKHETVRQQDEAKEQEELRLQQLKMQLCTYERETDELRMQVAKLQQTIAEHDQDQHLQEQKVLEGLDAVIGDIDDDEEDENDDENVRDADTSQTESAAALIGEMLGVQEEDKQLDDEQDKPSNTEKNKTVKKKKGKASQRFELDPKQKVRKSTVMKLLKNSNLNQGEGSKGVLEAIFNAVDSDGEQDGDDSLMDGCDNRAGAGLSQPDKTSEADTDADGESDADIANDEFVNGKLNGSSDQEQDHQQPKLETLATIVCDSENSNTSLTELRPDQTMEMLQEECEFYKEKNAALASSIGTLHEQLAELKLQLQQKSEESESYKELHGDTANRSKDFEQEVAEDLATMNNEQVKREEELIVYKELLEQSESSNMQLRTEMSMLMKQKPAYGQSLMIRLALPLGCIALATIIYYMSTRF